MDLHFKQKPKNAWNAVLTQLLIWSFRRFCVHRLTTDDEELWDSHLDLLRAHAPKGFEPLLDTWTDPEHMANIPNLPELDAYFRALVKQLDEAVTDEEEDAISKILDEDMSPTLERWLGTAYAPYSLFPTPSEPDDTIDTTKLNAILYLLSIKHRNIAKTRRVTGRRSITPIKTHLRVKTRRNKKNVQLQLSAGTHGPDAAGRSNKDKEGDSQQGKGSEGGHHEDERKDGQEQEGAHKEGDQEHQGAHLHAEPVHEPSAHKSELQKDS